MHSRVRLGAMAVAATIGAVAVGLAVSWDYAPVAGWDAAALLFCIWVWSAIGRLDPELTKSHATREDPGRGASDVILILAALASLGAVTIVLVHADSATGASRGLLAGLGLASVFSSWFAIHTLYTLRYASQYYIDPVGGIDFNQENKASYVDFAYLAFTIGMTFQVSDTNITARAIRATALRHALLSYLFGAVILASSINLIVNIGSGN